MRPDIIKKHESQVGSKREFNMKINTTINIRSEIMGRIIKASSSMNISLNRIVSILIIRMVHNSALKIKMFTSVKYQDTGKEIIWHKLHVSFTDDVYEKAIDLRKVLKMSVSFIIAKAVENILNEILNDFFKTKSTDNYFRNYVFIPNYHNGVLYFTIFWQYPPDIILKNHVK